MTKIPENLLGLDRIQGDRDYQEDNCAAFTTEHDGAPAVLLALADGMGGHVAGDTASALALQSAVRAFEDVTGTLEDRLRASIESANEAVAQKIAQSTELDGMGTTLVLAVISKAGLMWASVGDSPLWLCAGGEIERVNADHSMSSVFKDLVLAGRMTEEEARTDKRRNALRSAICGDEIPLMEVTQTPLVLLGNETVLLASDGVETLSENALAELVEQSKGDMAGLVSQTLEHITDIAKPNQDNATLIALNTALVFDADPISEKGDHD